MKKYFIALLVSISFMSIQTASAATITLSSIFGGSVNTATGTTVSGTASGAPLTPFLNLSASVWKFSLSSTADVTFGLSNVAATPLMFNGFVSTNPFFIPGTNVSTFSNLLSGTASSLAAGDYYIGILSNLGFGGMSYDLNVSTPPMPQVPVPAAVWLFGSGLMGLLGTARRKNRSALAA